MKQFNQWFSDTYGCTIEQFKELCGLYHTPDVDGVFKAIKRRYEKVKIKCKNSDKIE